MTHPNPRYANGNHADELERSLTPPMYLEERTVTFGGETWVVDSYDPRVDRRQRVMADGTVMRDPAWCGMVATDGQRRPILRQRRLRPEAEEWRRSTG